MNWRHSIACSATALALSLAGVQHAASAHVTDDLLAMGPDPGGKRGTAFDPDSIRTDHPGLKEPPIDPTTRGPVVNGTRPPANEKAKTGEIIRMDKEPKSR